MSSLLLLVMTLLNIGVQKNYNQEDGSILYEKSLFQSHDSTYYNKGHRTISRLVRDSKRTLLKQTYPILNLDCIKNELETSIGRDFNYQINKTCLLYNNTAINPNEWGICYVSSPGSIPGWISNYYESGTIRGVPQKNDEGSHSLIFRVCKTYYYGCSHECSRDATLHIKVTKREWNWDCGIGSPLNISDFSRKDGNKLFLVIVGAILTCLSSCLACVGGFKKRCPELVAIIVFVEFLINSGNIFITSSSISLYGLSSGMGVVLDIGSLVASSISLLAPCCFIACCAASRRSLGNNNRSYGEF